MNSPSRPLPSSSCRLVSGQPPGADALSPLFYTLVSLAAVVLSGCETDGTQPKPRSKEEKELLEGGVTGDDIEQMRNFARLYWDKSEYKKAAKQYQRILEVEPKDPEATLGLGMSYAQIGAEEPGYFEDGKKLLRTYNDELAKEGDTRGLMALGILHFKQGTHTADQVERGLKQRMELEDRLGTVNDRRLGSDSATEKRRLDKESEDLHAQLTEADAGVTQLQKAKDEQIGQAVNYLTQTIEGNPLEVLPYKLRAEANSLRGPDHYADAVDDIDTYLDLTVISGRERYEKMLASGKDGEGREINKDAAMSTLTRLDRLEALLLEMRASLLRRMGKPTEAVRDLERVLYLFPERSSAYAELARACEEMGEYQRAIEYYEQYMAAVPVGAIDAKAEARMRIEDLKSKIGAPLPK